jgi:2-polyprenyl-3-methyl-5-hydroxy-6-metoxy-1,4-benzoquinol methylase
VRLTTAPENLVEKVLLASGVVPTPLADTMVALLLARTIMTATKLGIFEALEDGPLDASQVAKCCKTDERATRKLLFALAGTRYLQAKGDEYSLSPIARKWMLKSSPQSLHDATLQRYLDAALMEHAEEFLLTGEPVNFHDKMPPEQWEVYQRGQRSHALSAAPEVAQRTPVPPNPQQMLDIGGAHGYFSVALCKRHPQLHSTILDLPEAVEQSRVILAQDLEHEKMHGRVVHRAGNALSDDLGEDLYDLVFIANLLHHFDDASNRDLMKRVARSLKPNGVCVISEIIRSETPEAAGQIGALTEFFFAITSASGTWSFAEMAEWQREAGLVALQPIRLRLLPGYGMQAARQTCFVHDMRELCRD